MRYVYPVILERDEDGRYVASTPDIPEARTDGASQSEALREMSEALAAALAGYAIDGRALPVPTGARPGQHLVPVAPLVAAKLALRSAMHDEQVPNVELARRLGVTEAVARRLIDPDHASRLDRVVAALAVVGRELIVEDHKQSAA